MTTVSLTYSVKEISLHILERSFFGWYLKEAKIVKSIVQLLFFFEMIQISLLDTKPGCGKGVEIYFNDLISKLQAKCTHALWRGQGR